MKKQVSKVRLVRNTIVVLAVLMSTLSSTILFARGNSNSDQLKLTIGSQDSPDSVGGKGILAIKDELARLSDGTMVLEPFFSSQLGDYKAMAGQVSSGELDMLTSGYPDMSFLVPAFEVIGEPYVVTNYEQLQKIVQGDFASQLHQELQDKKNIKFLDVWYTGARQVTSNRALNSIEDFKGLKLRTPNVPFLIHFAEAAGATPSPIAFQEVYLALQTNQVEAQENPLTTINTMKFYEVQSHIAITNHFIASAGVWIHQKKWKSFTDQQKDWLMKAIAKGREVNNNLAFQDEKSLIAVFESKGLTVTRPDIKPFQKAMQSFYAKLDQKYSRYGKNLINKLQQQ